MRGALGATGHDRKPGRSRGMGKVPGGTTHGLEWLAAPSLGVAESSSLASSMYLGVPGGVNEIVDHVVRLEVLCSLEGCEEGVLCRQAQNRDIKPLWPVWDCSRVYPYIL